VEAGQVVQWDKLFNEIKPMTLPKQECRRMEAPQCSTVEPAADGQTTTPSGQTTADLVPGSQNARAQEAHGPAKDEASPTAALSSPHTEAGGQTVGPGCPIADSCRVDASSGANMISSPTGMEEHIDDDLLDYEPSPTRNGMEINVM
jgi:hypothetical protein